MAEENEMPEWRLDRHTAYVPDLIPDGDLAMYRKANFGHAIGWGRKIGIVVVDMTRAFVEDRFALGSAKMGQLALHGIARLLEVARPIGLLVVFTRMVPFRNRTEAGRWYDSCPGVFGDPDDAASRESAEIPPEIAPRPEEPVIVKSKPSAFFGTPLHSMLTFHNVDTLLITGMVTSGCVRATVDDAFSHDYRVVIPEECVADRAEVPHRVNLFDMEMISADVLPLDQVLRHLRGLDRTVYGSDLHRNTRGTTGTDVPL
jgi:maleamate amidohydrolase